MKINPKKLALHFIFLLLCVATIVAGCGGDKKKSKTEADTTRIAGRVDLFTGFGVRTDRGGLAARIGKDAVVKVYELSDDGKTVKPVAGAGSAPLDENGGFLITGIPAGKINLIVRVDAANGTPLLGAILPEAPSTMGGISGLLITPETDVETQVFMKVVQQGIRAAGDVKPAKLDTLFIKRLVTADAALDADAAAQADKVVDKLTAAVRGGYAAFLNSALNKTASPEDAALLAALASTRRNRMADQSRIERSLLENTKDDGEDRVATKGNRLPAMFLSDDAAVGTAYESGLDRAVDCVRGRKIIAACAAGPSFEGLANAMGAEITLERGVADIALRASAFLPESASGSEGFLAPAVIIARYLNIEPSAQAGYRKAMAAAAASLSPDADPTEQSAKEAREFIRSLATTYILRSTGMPEKVLSDVAAAWQNPQHDFAMALGDSGNPLNERDTAANKFYKALNDGANPIRKYIDEKYDKLPAGDRRLLAAAVTQLYADSTLFNAPFAALRSKDKDGDGTPDNIETALGTNPDDADSRPSMPSPSTPGALLPGLKAADMPAAPAPCIGGGCDDNKQMTVVSGKVEGGGVDTAIGLYPKLSFLDRKPIFAARADSEGAFKIDARAGRYFVVAWRDTAKSGAPGSGDRAGWHGARLPARVDARENVKLGAAVKLFARVGRAGCPEKQVADPLTGGCAAECPAGLKRDEATQSCSCPDGKFFNAGTKTCADACPGGSHSDTERVCVCADGAKMDAKTGACACPADMKLDSSGSACGCATGYLNKENMTCAATCMETYVANDARKTCECPAGSSRASDGLCRCETGLMNTANGACVSRCPAGTEEDAMRGLCRCVPGAAPNPKTGTCECPKGYRTAKNGSCKPDCPEGFVIGADDNCSRPEHGNNQLIPAPPGPPASGTPPLPFPVIINQLKGLNPGLRETPAKP